MAPELDELLCARYPLIFAERHGDPSTTSMCWGFETGDGWFSLINVLCRELQRETEEQGAPQVTASQVKAKGGSLRFHVGSASDRQRAMIDLARAISRHMCDACGTMEAADENLVAGGPTRCRACRSK